MYIHITKVIKDQEGKSSELSIEVFNLTSKLTTTIKQPKLPTTEIQTKETRKLAKAMGAYRCVDVQVWVWERVFGSKLNNTLHQTTTLSPTRKKSRSPATPLPT